MNWIIYFAGLAVIFYVMLRQHLDIKVLRILVDGLTKASHNHSNNICELNEETKAGGLLHEMMIERVDKLEELLQ